MHTGKTIPLQMFRPTGNTEWCSQPNMDSGDHCMVETKRSHHLVHNYTHYSQQTTPHSHSGSALTWQSGWVIWASPWWTGSIITKHVNTKEKLKVETCPAGDTSDVCCCCVGQPDITVTAWMNIRGVTHPGMGTWSPEDPSLSRLWHWLIVWLEKILSLICKYKKIQKM